jgi:nitrite reductase/ring-hydroxylating ferredoxin subunit
MAEYVAVAAEDEIPDGTIRSFDVGAVEVAVAHCAGEWYAVDNICSHAHAYLAEGELDTDDCLIECPLHGARFDLATGRVRSLPATEPIATYPVRVIDGRVEVAVDT